MIVRRHHLHDAVTETNLFRSRGYGGEKDGRCGKMIVLAGEMMFGEEDIVEAHLVGQFDFGQAVSEQFGFLAGMPVIGIQRFGQLHLIEQAKLHGRLLDTRMI